MTNADLCAICAGEQGPGHKHICDHCGRDAGSRALVYGADGEEKRFYCDKYCAVGGEAELEGSNPDSESATGLILAARKIKGDLEKLGVDWRKV